MKPSANQGKRLHKILIMKPTKTVITDINDINGYYEVYEFNLNSNLCIH